MDANNKLLIKNTTFLFIRMGFSMVVSLFTSRILLNTIGAVDYGIYNVVAGFIIIVTFINGPLGTASMRFITSALGSRDHDRLTKIFNSSFYLHIFVGIAAVLIAETLGFYFFSKQMNIPSDRFFASSVVFQIATIQLFFKFINILFSSVLIAHEHMNVFAYLGISISALQFIGVYTLHYWTFDFLILYAVLVFSIDFLSFLFYFIYCRKQFPECTYQFVKEKEHYKSLFSFLSFDLLGNLGSIIQTQGLNILLNIYGGPLLNASRAISYQIEGNLRSFSENFMTAIKPQIIKSYACGNFERTIQLVYRGAILSFTLFGLLCLPLIFNLDYIIELWLKMLPKYVVPFTQITLLTAQSFTIHIPFLYLVIATGKNKWTNITSGSLLFVSFVILWISLSQGVHPVGAFGLIFLFRLITDFGTYIIIRQQKLFPQFSISNIVKKLYIPLYLSFAISAIVTYFAGQIFLTPFLKLSTSLITSIITLSASIYCFALSTSDRMIIREKLIDIRSKVSSRF